MRASRKRAALDQMSSTATSSANRQRRGTLNGPPMLPALVAPLPGRGTPRCSARLIAFSHLAPGRESTLDAGRVGDDGDVRIQIEGDLLAVAPADVEVIEVGEGAE